MPEAVRVKNEEAQGPSRPPMQIGVPGPLKKLAEYPQRFRQFLHEVRVELRQVTWPTRADVQATTAVVIVTVFFFGLYLFLVDSGASKVVEFVLSKFRP